MIVNALLILCSLPLITAGAALSAAYHALGKLADCSCSAVAKTFWGAFRANFKASLISWLASLSVFAVFIVQYVFILSLENGAFRNVWSVLWLGFLLVFVAILSYLFPLIARYDNGMKQHWINSAILSIAHLPRTLIITALNALPFIILLTKPSVFFYLLPFWMLLGFSVIARINVEIMKPMLVKLDAMSDGAVPINEED